jgi:hypothetical protein
VRRSVRKCKRKRNRIKNQEYREKTSIYMQFSTKIMKKILAPGEIAIRMKTQKILKQWLFIQ